MRCGATKRTRFPTWPLWSDPFMDFPGEANSDGTVSWRPENGSRPLMPLEGERPREPCLPWGRRWPPRHCLPPAVVGMNVDWTTIEAVAAPHAMDCWYLFPLGIGVNRLLRKDGRIPAAWENRLTRLFGTDAWRDVFYSEETSQLLFGPPKKTVSKTATFEDIKSFLISRLRTIFAGVAETPAILRNSRNNPMYLFCFASGNPRGAPIALRIADHILNHLE